MPIRLIDCPAFVKQAEKRLGTSIEIETTAALADEALLRTESHAGVRVTVKI